MLPLQQWLFNPTVFVAPVVLLAFFWLRKRRTNSYPYVWWYAMLIAAVLCGLFCTMVLRMPLYSEQEHRTLNPGGFSVGVPALLAWLVMLFGLTCIVIPAFPVLIGLASVPPYDWGNRQRMLLVACCIVYIAGLGWLVFQKNSKYVADYQQAKQQKLQQGDQFQHVRRP